MIPAERPPQACPRCAGRIIDYRAIGWEPACLNCGWCWWSARQLSRSRAAFALDRIFMLIGGVRARPMAYDSVERMAAAEKRHKHGKRHQYAA